MININEINEDDSENTSNQDLILLSNVNDT